MFNIEKNRISNLLRIIDDMITNDDIREINLSKKDLETIKTSLEYKFKAVSEMEEAIRILENTRNHMIEYNKSNKIKYSDDIISAYTLAVDNMRSTFM